MSKERTLHYGKAVQAVHQEGMPLDEAVAKFVSQPLSKSEETTIKIDVLYAGAINDAVNRMEEMASTRPPYGLVKCINDGNTPRPGSVLNMQRDFMTVPEHPSLKDKGSSREVPEDFYQLISNFSMYLKHSFYYAIAQEYRNQNKSLVTSKEIGQFVEEDPAFKVYRGMGTAKHAFEYTLQMVFERLEFHNGRRPTFGEFRTYAKNSTGYLLMNMVNNMENVDQVSMFTNGVFTETGEQVLDIDPKKEKLAPIRPAYDVALRLTREPSNNPNVTCPAVYSTVSDTEAPVIRLYNHLIDALT